MRQLQTVYFGANGFETYVHDMRDGQSLEAAWADVAERVESLDQTFVAAALIGAGDEDVDLEDPVGLLDSMKWALERADLLKAPATTCEHLIEVGRLIIGDPSEGS